MPEETVTFISPNTLYQDPKRWLSVEHVLHETLDVVMDKLFPDWYEKRSHVVCFQCHGRKPKIMYDRKARRMVMIIGSVRIAETDQVLYHVQPLEDQHGWLASSN